MNNLHHFTNVDKAALLHQLFPQEIPELLEFITGMCQSIREDEQRNRKAWDDGFMSFDYWLSLLNQTEQIIKFRSKAITGSHRVFSEQLFSGYTALFVNHCIWVYTSTRKPADPKFTLAVQLLFYP
ncbi:MAG TPA: hypothetical protein VKB19_12495 [Pedobacter sp.]|nr:hypothetical protein [Pedobacter sp.]